MSYVSTTARPPHPSTAGTEQRELELEHVTIVEKGPLRKAISGATMGNLMEWYDFGIYGYLTATMTKVFQPENAGSLGTVVTLAAFAVSFLARPFGGLVFGPLGDKIGRQKTLAITMLSMSVATGLIGALPSYASIGWWSFVALIACRLVQGFSTGGEYSGATTFVSEYSPDRRRGYFASFLDVGSYLGFAVGAAVVALTSTIVGETNLDSWGWRIPFLLALPFGLMALLFRLRIDESPTFESTQAANEAVEETNSSVEEAQQQLGPVGIVKHHWRPLLIAMALVGATNTAGYSLTSYMPAYLESNHGYTAVGAAVVTIPALLALSISVPFIGRLSDKVGRKPILWTAVISTLVCTIPAYLMMANKTGAFAAMFILAFSVAFYIAVSASALPALFPTASRFGGMALSYNVAVSLFGGTAPVLGEELVNLTGSKIAPAYYTMFFSVLAAFALLGMKESARRPLPGSMPSVLSEAEARELVETQHENPDIEHSELPWDAHDAAQDASAHTNDTDAAHRQEALTSAR